MFEPELYAGVPTLNEAETAEYVAHRLRLAGCIDEEIFADDALGLVYRLSAGQPQNIDQVCSMALKCAFANNESFVTRDSVSMAAVRLGHAAPEHKAPIAAVPGPAYEVGGSANQDWAEVAKEFDVQGKIIARLHEEAGTSSRQIETLQAKVAELALVGAERQREAAERSEMQETIQSMVESIAELQQCYAAATEENRRLADQLRSIADAGEADRGGNGSADADDAQLEPSDRYAENPAAGRPTVVAAGNGEVSEVTEVREQRFLVSGASAADGSRYAIRDGRMSIGKGFDNDFRIVSDYVSAHHAHIDSGEHNSVLIDLDTINGTFVNGRRIRRHALRDGDEITIGKHRFWFVREQSPKRTTYGGVVGPGSGSWLDTSRFSAYRDRGRKNYF